MPSGSEISKVEGRLVVSTGNIKVNSEGVERYKVTQQEVRVPPERQEA